MSAKRRRVAVERVAGERELLVAAGINAVGIGMFIPFTLVFFHHVTGLSFASVGMVLTVTGLAGLALMPLAGVAVDRFGAKPVVLVLYAIRTLGFLLYPSRPRCPPSPPSPCSPPSPTAPSPSSSSR